MKNLFLKTKEGFTLVELMVVVAIIGILSSIAIPNFKKYQAKAKQSEAKILLASVYTAQVSALADYSSYCSDLLFVGVDQPGKGFYRVGFTTAYQGGPSTITGCSASNQYLDAAPKMSAKGTAPTALTGSAMDQTTFTAAATGNVSSTSATSDLWTMTDTKTLTNTAPGI